LFLIVDVRRGISEADEDVIAWSNPQQRHVHVLLAKTDKLTRSLASQALATARRQLGGQVSVQLFSAHAGGGVAQAQETLIAWLANKKTPVTSHEVTGAD
jgi:GTP-binding protein